MVNALASETSPYLLRHKHNSVASQPWGPAAIARARDTDRPPARDGIATAYVCERFTCQTPVTQPAELQELLRSGT